MKNKNCKYIFVTGGVLSGVGKGITAASIGAILKEKGCKVSVQKCDPYLNVDAGMLNPLEHGECFVTKDGAETDLDLGHYERFLDVELTRNATTLSGMIYRELIEKERAGKFNGKTVQMVPHFTNLVQEKIEKSSEGSDIHIVEIGGTVGDYESLAFIEAIRLFANKVGRRNCLYMSVVYVPWINTSKELKTKPAQNALRDLREFGIIPDVVCVRTEEQAPRSICEKIASFAGIDKNAVVNLPDIDSVYDVPLNILKSGVLEILDDFVSNTNAPEMKKWREFSRKRVKNYEKNVKIGLVTKYLGNEDVCLSVLEALKAAGIWEGIGVEIEWIDANGEMDLSKVDGVVEMEGFGNFAEDGAAMQVLKSGKSYLGLGRDDGEKWLGEKEIELDKGSLVQKIYGEEVITERVRFKYELRGELLTEIEKYGVKVVGKKGKIPMVLEGKDWFVMIQARPEYKSRPLRVHPLFRGFVKSLE